MSILEFFTTAPRLKGKQVRTIEADGKMDELIKAIEAERHNTSKGNFSEGQGKFNGITVTRIGEAKKVILQTSQEPT